MKKMKYLFLLLLCAAALSVSAFAAYGPQNLTIPDSAEAIVYGQSGAGRNLMAYRFGHGDNVIVLGFAIHGYEDNWSRDGEALVYTAGQLMQKLDENMDTVEDWGWSVYVLPCMNPDGLLDGWTNDGPGRCTTSYYKNGSLAATWGVDMNRSFPTAWSQRTSDRNWTGSAPLACKESQALAQFVQDVRGSGTNLCIDTHGWMSQIITSNGYSKLYNVFKARFPGNTYANCNNGGGYFTAYTASLGYASCLFEFPDGLYSMSAFKNSGYCEKYVDCVMELLVQYGTYSPKPVEPEPVEPEPEDPHLALCPTKDYQDVPRDAWYHEAVDCMVQNEIMLGTNGYFEPETVITRATMVEVLWRAAGRPAMDFRAFEDQIRERVYAADGAEEISDDVKEQYIAWLVADPDEGIWSVCGMTYAPTAWYFTQSSEGNVRLNMRVYQNGDDYAYCLYSADWDGTQVTLTQRGQPVTKEQVPSNTVTIVTRDPNARWNAGYSDIYEDMDCVFAVCWASQNGIVNGYPDGTFKPDQFVTRQEMAAILHRTAQALGRDMGGGVSLEQFPDGWKTADYALEAMRWAVGQSYIHGSAEGSQVLLLPEGNTTRSQLAALMVRFFHYVPEPVQITAAAPVTAAVPEPVQEPNIDADGGDLDGN